MLYAPNSAPDTTVLLTNLSDGWQTLANSLATRTPGRHVAIRSIAGEYPLHAMHVWLNGRSGRYVRAMKDPRWDFFEQGPRLEFEDSALYEERLIRRRLGRATLVQYLIALGWDVTQDGFFKSSRPGRYVKQCFRTT